MALRRDDAQPAVGGAHPMTVQVTEHRGVAVCSLAGMAEPGDLTRLAAKVRELRRRAVHVVLDLDELTLVHPEAISGFLTRLSSERSSRPLLLCCSRLSGRRLLRRCGAGRVGAVVPSVADALHQLQRDDPEPPLALFG